MAANNNLAADVFISGAPLVVVGGRTTVGLDYFSNGSPVWGIVDGTAAGGGGAFTGTGAITLSHITLDGSGTVSAPPAGPPIGSAMLVGAGL